MTPAQRALRATVRFAFLSLVVLAGMLAFGELQALLGLQE